MFMRHPGVYLILATGGAAMVKAAYSSGTPAIGVGSGNVPALVCADADPAAAAGVRRDRPIRVLVLPAPLERADGPLGREKLAPLLSLSTVDGTSQGLEVCDTVTYTNLLNTKRLARPFI